MDNEKSGKSAKSLTLFGFFAIIASLFITVYEYPTFATSGLQLVFFLLLCGFCWFLPVALCSAEMATVEGWQEGGIFAWVGKTLGKRFGFAAIFFQWFQVTVGFVTMIYFILGSLSYIFNFKALDNNPMVKFIGVLVIFWLLTFSQFKGTKFTANVAKIGFVFGITIPVLTLFGLSIAYIASGNPLQLHVSAGSFIPKLKDMSALVVFMLAYMGVEASAPHINEMKNPKKDYPLAMIMLILVGIVLNTIGGASVAAVVPLKDLSLSSGVIQTFEVLILKYGSGLGWLVKLIAGLIAFGVMAQVCSWIVGPTRGLLTVAEEGILPAKFKEVNKNNVPVPLILVQGLIVSIWAAVLTFGGGGNNVSFLTAISLTVVIYLIGYVLFFIAYFILVLKKDNLDRTYHVPGGKGVKLTIAAIGLIMSILAILTAFIPPASLTGHSAHSYELILAISFIVTLLLPFIIYMFRNKSEVGKKEDIKGLVAKIESDEASNVI